MAEVAETTPRRPLSVRTTSNGRAPTTLEGRTAHDGEVAGEPVSPSARLVEDFFIVAVLGFASPANLSAFRQGIGARMACHPRFCSIQAADKDGVLRWVPTTVSLDYHVFCPTLDSAAVAANPDKAVEDYVASLSARPMDHSRPLWEFHLLDVPTSEATSTAVLRVHHSLGDGISLITLLISCTRSATDPTRLPAMPPPPKRTGAIYARPRPPASAGALAFAWWVWSFVVLAWHSLVDLATFFATILFLKDSPTLFTTTGHGEFHRKRVVHRGLSLQDVKAVKEALNCTVNDVLVGVTDAALSRYYYRKSGATETGKMIRLRSIIPVNLRQPTSLHACVKMIESGKGSDIKWGNEIGFILLPLRIAMHSDPLDYVLKAKTTVDRKKSSFEVAFTHVAIEVIFKLFGPKAGAAIFSRMLSHTTTSLSNMVGPVEQVEFYGNPIVFIAPTTYVPEEAIVVNYQSYVNTVRIVLSVDEAQFPDCHDLLDDFAESLKLIKDAATCLEKNSHES